MLVIIKEILNKMYFHVPPELLSPILHYLHATYRLPFWHNLVPPRCPDNKFQIFSIQSLPPPPGAQNKSFKLQLYTDIETDVQMQMTTLGCLPPDLKYPLPTKTVHM